MHKFGPLIIVSSLSATACQPKDSPGGVFDDTQSGTGDSSGPVTTPTTSAGTSTGSGDSGAPTTDGGGTDSDSEGVACGGQVLVVRQFDTAPDTGWNALTIAVDGAGNLLLAGGFSGQANFGGDTLDSVDLSEDAYVAKFSPSGEHLWSRRFGAPFEQRVTTIAAAPDGDVVLGGWFRGDIDLGGGVLTSAGLTDGFVARLTPDGAHVWSRSLGGAELDMVLDVAADDDGVAFAAMGLGPLDLGGGPVGTPLGNNGFIARLDGAGDHLWSRGFGTTEPFHAMAPINLALDPSGDVLVTGEFEGSVDFGGGPLAVDDGSTVYVARWTGAGEFKWALQGDGMATSDVPHVAAIASDAGGSARLGGSFSGTFGLGGAPLVGTGMSDAFVAVLDPQGAPVWSSGYGAQAAKAQSVLELASDAAGFTAVVGEFAGGIDFGDAPLLAGEDDVDGFVAKLGPDGAPLWSRAFGHPNWTVASEVAIDGEGSVWVAGLFRDQLIIDGHSLQANEYDTFLMKLCP